MTWRRAIALLVVGLAVVIMLLRHYRDELVAAADARAVLFGELQPVALANCELQRFGEANDGGYLLCGNLLGDVEGAYSYGISGYDGWGCEVSQRLSLAVHEYDCFDTRRPACPSGQLVFHEECVGGAARVVEGRVFKTLAEGLAENGHTIGSVLVKMDVEGAEWDTLEAASDDVLQRIDQLAIELHGIEGEQRLRVLRRLKAHFYVANLHFNNYACRPGLAPFPADVFEILLVNRRLGRPDLSRGPAAPQPLDSPNNPKAPDCQSVR